MTQSMSLWLFQTIHAIGMSVWVSIAVINNCRAFSGSVSAIGATMTMERFKHAPGIETPLLERAIGSRIWHRSALLCVFALQMVAAVAFWVGSYEMVIGGGLDAARAWLNIALCSFATCLFAMHLGGLWFGYWIRQEGLQQTHIALLTWIVATFFLFNAQ